MKTPERKESPFQRVGECLYRYICELHHIHMKRTMARSG
jgi:hypothetical protein